MDYDLPESVVQLKLLARDFAAREIAPYAADWSEREVFPSQVFRKLGDIGLMGMLVPEEYGGAAAGCVAFVAVMEELGNADQSVAAAWNAHSTIASLPLAAFGTDQQKADWLVPLARGEKIGAFGLTEASAGSDARAIRTRAVRVSGGWRINGTKMFITNAGTDMSIGVTILAVTEGQDGHRSYVTLFVPEGTPGYSKGQRLRKLGWHALDTRELIFDDCWVSDDNLIGIIGGGLRQFLEVLDKGRISVAALALSLASAALRLALKHARERHQFGQPLVAFQAISHKLADMATEIAAARELVYRAAWLADRGRPCVSAAAMAKLYASEVANRAISDSLQIHGGYGYIRESEVSRFYADAKILEIGEGTSEIQRNVIARELVR